MLPCATSQLLSRPIFSYFPPQKVLLFRVVGARFVPELLHHGAHLVCVAALVPVVFPLRGPVLFDLQRCVRPFSAVPGVRFVPIVAECARHVLNTLGRSAQLPHCVPIGFHPLTQLTLVLHCCSTFFLVLPVLPHEFAESLFPLI
uniref:Uncharacterized protein n=1 Tax=Cacopsylla melanoneura TaxID=428564 RepID=A0A8D8ZAR7_9HEMI